VRDRPVQFLSVLLALLALVGAGALLPRIVAESDEAKLRYTDVSLEGAPPIVAVGAAVGALLGTGDQLSDIVTIYTLFGVGLLGPAYALLTMVLLSFAAQVWSQCVALGPL
jgi:hypothetical protein